MIIDTAVTDCGYNYGYNSEDMFPVTNVLEATMNQIAYHKLCQLQSNYVDFSRAGASKNGVMLLYIGFPCCGSTQGAFE